METTADRLRLARESFPEFADLLTENIIDQLARQLDHGNLDAVIAGAAHRNAPERFREVLELVVRAGEDDKRRRARPGEPGDRRGGAKLGRPPAPSRPEPTPPTAKTADQRTAPPISSRIDRGTANPGAKAEAEPPAAEDRQRATAEDAKQARPDPQPGQPTPQQIDVSAFTGRVDAFASADGQLQASEAGGVIELSWTPLDSSRVVVYLIAGSAVESPDSLHGAQRLAATIDVSHIVPRDSGPHFTVFAYEGGSVEEAVRAIGRPHAQTSLLLEVQDLVAVPHARTVMLRWTRPVGVDRVRISRSRPDQLLPQHFDPTLVLATVDGDFFEDQTATPGARHIYRVQAMNAKADTASRGVEVLAEVPVTLCAVTDLRIETELHNGDLLANLRYSQPPAGRVTIMQSARQPKEVSSSRILPEAQLAGLELGEPVIKEVVAVNDTERLIPRLPLSNSGSTVTYFTAVTTGGGQFMVGNSIPVHHIAPVRDVEVIDRVDYQIVRFAWPAGANAVMYQVAPPDGPPAEDSAEWKYCYRRSYDDLGGIRLVLPDTGARIYVRGVQHFGAEQYRGGIDKVDYPGRWVVRYRFVPVPGDTGVALEVNSESRLSGLFLEIQHHPTRWPTVSAMRAEPPQGTKTASLSVEREIAAGQWTAVTGPLSFEPGFVRAFLVPKQSGGRPVMVVDPDPEVGRNAPGRAASLEGLRNRWAGWAQGNKPAAADQPARRIRCLHCLQFFPEEQIVVRCPPAGSCAPVPDPERGRYVGKIPESKPVHTVDAATGGHAIRCPRCGTPGSPRVCPLCHGELPANWAAQDWFALTFVGAKYTGKTVTMTVLQHELRSRVVRAMARTMIAADPFTTEQVRKFENRLYNEKLVNEGTQVAAVNPNARVPMVFDLGLGGNADRPAAVVLFDVSGEDMGDVSTTQQYAHLLTWSDGLVFLFDPLQLEEVQDYIRGHAPGYADFPEVEIDPTQVLHNIIQVIRNELGQDIGRLPARLSVVVSKLDSLQFGARENIDGLADLISPGSVLMRDPYMARDDAPLFLPGDAELQHREVRGLLERLGATDFLNLLASNFTDYRFFAQSALGHAPISGETLSDAGVNSYRLADVVRMFLAEKQW